MKHNIFTSTKNWRFTVNDELAEGKFKQIEAEARSTLPENFYHRPLLEFERLKSTKLYQLLKTIPKGCMHHNHYFCNDDEDFYRDFIVNDPRIYLTADLKGMEIGTAEQAKQKGWISMKEGQQKYGEQNWLKKVVDLTAFTKDELQQLNYKRKETWDVFQSKIRTPLKLFFVRDIYEKYSRHVLTKYVKNGYDRIQMRSTYERLKQYDSEGNFVMQHGIELFMSILDDIVSDLNKQHPHFTFGLIVVGFKMLSDENNKKIFKAACETNWSKLIGFDFVQEEDKYDPLQKYDPIVDAIFQEFPHLGHLKKVYHAGETTDHLIDNIDVAVKAGSVRLGHGVNITQRIEFLTHCKQICFERNPLSNLLLGYKNDLRDSSTPLLLGLGYPVSISPDDSGKFGYEDTTPDYFAAALCYNWSLRHLKLVAYHSINHSVCEEAAKSQMLKSFEAAWDQWVRHFLQEQHITENTSLYHYEDIFTFSKKWSFSTKEDNVNARFIKFLDKVVSDLPEDIYQNQFINAKALIKASPLFAHLKNMPKGSLLSCHFLGNLDPEFIRTQVLPFHDLYLNDYSKEILIGTPQQGEAHSWTSLDKLKLRYENEEELAAFVYSLVSFSSQELGSAAGNSGQFWRIFEKKRANLFRLISSVDLFRKYTRHTLAKLARLNYSRVEFRLEPIRLMQYSESGEAIQRQEYCEITRIIDEQLAFIRQEHPCFTVGVIVLGNKTLSSQQNFAIFDYFAALKWSKVVGFDFEQTDQDSFPPLCDYNKIVDKVLIRHEDIPYARLYQAGNSSSHSNCNIAQALQSGTVRIANGLNVFQHISELSRCNQVCFQLNPVLNVVQGASKTADFRLSVAPILLGLGFPVSLSADWCGLLGFEDPISDLFLAAVSYNWSLKHFKLAILHSITYARTTQGLQKQILADFQQKWHQWIYKLSLELPEI